MKANLTEDGTLMWWCPGCEEHHGVPVVGGNAWTWNGSEEKPTLNPSVLVYPHPRYKLPPTPRCHTYIREGSIEFLSDCEHDYKNKTVVIQDWKTT